MPASFVHETIALGAFHDFSARYPDAVLDENALLAGSQGPDPLFFYQVLSRGKNAPLMAWGERLHREHTSDFLLNLVERARNGDALSQCYALGFLTHYATDTTLHPYVYAHSFGPKGTYDNRLHGMLEGAMDTWLHRQQGGRGVPRQMNGIARLTHAKRTQIAQLLVGAMEAVFGQAPTQEQVVMSLDDCVKTVTLLHSPTGIKTQLLSLAALVIGMPGLVRAHALPARLPTWDFLHLTRLGWVSPWQQDGLRTQSVPLLLEAARQRGAQLMGYAWTLWQGELTSGDFAEKLGDLAYDAGIPWQRSKALSQGDGLDVL